MGAGANAGTALALRTAKTFRTTSLHRSVFA
jgi:hypothetical protein